MNRKITELRPHPKNLEIYGVEQVSDDFLASIKAKGVMVPLTIKADGTIISGHRRYEAAKLAGLESVPVGIATFDNELDELEALIEFNRQREKTFSQKMKEAETLEAIEAQRAKTRMLAAQNNKAAKEILPELMPGQTRDKVAKQTGIGSGKTYDVAKDLMKRVKAGDEAAKEAVQKIDKGELTIHGAKKELDKKQSYATIAKNLKISGHVEQSEQNKAAAEELDIKDGDIITIIGKQRHKIFVGSCESAEIKEQLKKCDCVVTDPPYGIGYKSPSGSGLAARGNYKVIENDDKEYDPAILFEICKKVITWGANHYANRLPNSAGWLVWDKRDGEQINNNSDCELAWTNLIGSARLLHHRWNGMIKASERGEKRIHPTQKPIALFKWAMDICSAGSKIADPYMGSGACLLACEESGRDCVAAEIDISYAAATVKRLAGMGLEVKINGQ